MYIDNIPLDITKRPEEILMDRFNAVNGLNLSLDDFVLSPAEVNTDPLYPQANTRVTVRPKAVSKFYNSFSIYYNRMDFATIVDNPAVSILRGNAEHLSDLVDEINTGYAIYLRAEDYEEQNLPAIDPNDPNKVVDVELQAKSGSYLFIGHGTIHLNKAATYPSLGSVERGQAYILIKNPPTSAKEHEVIVRSLDGSTIPTYSFFRNAKDITTCRITRMLKIEQGLLLYGMFVFKANLSGSEQSYTTNAVLLGGDGAILKNCNGLYAADYIEQVKPVVTTKPGYTYFVDDTNALSNHDSHLYRYRSDGILDTQFRLSTTNRVIYARVDKEGKIYTLSQMLNVLEDADGDPNTPDTSVSQYWIERYNENGTLDATFDKVVLRMTGSIDPWPLAWIEPIELDRDSSLSGVYMGFAFNSKLDTLLPELPKINSTPIVNGSIQTSYGFLPVFRVSLTGQLDSSFKLLKPQFTPEAIYSYDADHKPDVNTAYFTAVGDSVTILSYRQNPITGKMQYMPMLYDKNGDYKPVSGDAYYDLPYFTKAKTIQSLRLNSTVVFGTAKLRHPTTREYLDAKQIVMLFDKSAKAQNVVYQADTTAKGTPEILDVWISQ